MSRNAVLATIFGPPLAEVPYRSLQAADRYLVSRAAQFPHLIGRKLTPEVKIEQESNLCDEVLTQVSARFRKRRQVNLFLGIWTRGRSFATGLPQRKVSRNEVRRPPSSFEVMR